MDVVLGKRQPKDQEADRINLILAQALKRDQLVHIIHKPTPSEKWSHLCAIYESADDSSLQRTAAEFYGLKFEENLEMASFLSNVSMLTTRLSELKKPVDEAMIMAKILASLPPSYEMFRVSWSSSSASDKTMANLTSRLLQEEARQQEKNPSSGSSDALFVKKTSGSTFSGSCYNCGKKGHRASDCRQKKIGNQIGMVVGTTTMAVVILAVDLDSKHLVHLHSMALKQMSQPAQTATSGWLIQGPRLTCVPGWTGLVILNPIKV